MIQYKRGLTRAEAEELGRIDARLRGGPWKGTNIGDGRHVDIPDVYTPGAPGWSDRWHEVTENEQSRGEFAYPIDTTVSENLAEDNARDESERRLTTEEQTRIGAAISGGENLPADWTRVIGEADAVR